MVVKLARNSLVVLVRLGGVFKQFWWRCQEGVFLVEKKSTYAGLETGYHYDVDGSLRQPLIIYVRMILRLAGYK